MDQKIEPWWQHVLEDTQSWRRAQAATWQSSPGTIRGSSSEPQPADQQTSPPETEVNQQGMLPELFHPHSHLSTPFFLEPPGNGGVEAAYHHPESIQHTTTGMGGSTPDQSDVDQPKSLQQIMTEMGWIAPTQSYTNQAGPVQENKKGIEGFAPNQGNTKKAGPIQQNTNGMVGSTPDQSYTNQTGPIQLNTNGRGVFAPNQSNDNQIDKTQHTQIELDLQVLRAMIPANFAG
ncbi:MAG: hypothetical protein Q9212_001958 [Teloschistes hypoglaucus]